MSKAQGLKASEAEREFGKWLKAHGWNFCRAIRTRWQRQDFWGALDFLCLLQRAVGRTPDTLVWGVQVTTQEGRTHRRRRIEAVDWPSAWRISLVSHERVPDPANRKRSRAFWRIEDFAGGKWSEPLAVPADSPSERAGEE